MGFRRLGVVCRSGFREVVANVDAEAGSEPLLYDLIYGDNLVAGTGFEPVTFRL